MSNVHLVPVRAPYRVCAEPAQKDPISDEAVAHGPPIVVAVDGTPATCDAILTAAMLARVLGGSLVLVHVLVPTEPRSMASARTALRTYRADVKNARVLLAEAQALAPDVVWNTELRFGDPADAICRAATDFDAPLVVVGTRGLNGLNRVILGSVSSAVVNRAACSVLVVRGGWSAAPGSAPVYEGVER